MNRPQISAAEPPRPGACLFSRAWPSRLDRKQEVMDQVTEVLVGRGWIADDERPWLLLCLDEVVVNAMVHGNEADPELDIVISVYSDGVIWALLVVDQGDGFSGEAVPDGDDPESLLLEHGRGIRLMHEWLDELTYYRNGACAFLARRIAPAKPAGGT